MKLHRACAVSAAAAMLSMPAVAANTAATMPPPPMLGVAWYPEQWPETRWDVDLTLMEQAGIRFVRMPGADNVNN